MTSSEHDDQRLPPRKRRFPRPLLWAIEGIGAILATLAIGVVILAIRLVAAPLDIDFLTPQLVAWADTRLDPYTVTIGKTRLRWRLGHSTIELEAVDTRIRAPAKDAVINIGSPDDASILGADVLSISLGLKPLLHQRVQPSRVTLTRPHVALIRAEDGTIAIPGVPQTPAETQPLDKAAIRHVLDQLAGTGSANQVRSKEPLARLDRVFVEHGNITVDDRALGAAWSLTDLGMTFQRTAGGWFVRSQGAAGAGAATSQLTGEMTYTAAPRRIAFSASAAGFNPSLWVANIHKLPAGLTQLSALQIAVEGHLAATVDLDRWTLGPVRLSLKGGPGRLVDARLSGGTLPVAGLDLAASYDPAARHAALDHARLDLDGPVIEITGHADQLPVLFSDPLIAPVPLVFDVELRNLPASRFDASWPPDVARNPRKWVLSHLSGGTITDLRTHLAAKWAPRRSLILDSATGTMQLAHFTLDYLPGLTRAREVDASAVFNQQKFDFTIENAKINDLAVSGGKAVIEGLDTSSQTIDLSLPISGPLPAVISLLASDRLKLAQRAGLSPDGVSGQVDGVLHFDFPLLSDLPLEKLNYSATAQLTAVVLPKIVLGRDLTEGMLKLNLDERILALDGSAKLDGHPATLQWSRRVSGDAPDAMRATVKLTLDDDARKRLGFDVLPDMVSGPVNVDATYIDHDGGRSEADLDLDLKPTTLTIAPVDWKKRPDIPAHASLNVILRDNHVKSIEGLKIDAPGLAAEGALVFADGNLLKQAHIGKLDFSGSQVGGEVTRNGDNWDVKLQGPRLDLSRYFKSIKNEKSSEPGKGALIYAALQTDELVLGDKRSLDHAQVDMTLQGSLDTLHLSGGVGHGKHAALDLDDPNKGGRFSLRTDDLGSVLRIAGVADNIKGGSLSIEGENHRIGAKRTYSGHLEGHDYRLLKAPVIARLLTVSSPTSIVSLLTGNGIPFDELVGDLKLEDGVMSIIDSRTHGSALGLTATGTINMNSNTIDLAGTVVPAYLLNSTIGKLPVVGDLITGGAGKGIFAVNYRLGGSLDHVQVSVNPLSVLAPGFLRNFFIFKAPKPAVPKVPAPENNPSAPASNNPLPAAKPPLVPTASPAAPTPG